MPLDLEVFTQFGIAGLILGVFFFTLIFILRQHSSVVKSIVDRMSTDFKESNEAWRQTFDSHSKREDVRQAETNLVLRDLTKVIAENNACMVQFQRAVPTPKEDEKKRHHSAEMNA